ncbi:hypothetical protein IC232_23415 [Microvirga sp. BT688]|uniref:DUF6544 family protein n=1 Tax=Microvirga sp. TaxID=1873136 RepID=UPI001688CABB|nr:DUF6544 family protein [Microvirga sp.]MBD2749631.1 hypothetical protein [Microvirga sp.]
MPKALAISVASVSAVCLVGAWGVRARDGRDARKAWDALAARAARPMARFDLKMVAGLPDPARRYFMFAITAGTPLRMVAELKMAGEIGLGDQERPNYQPMNAEEILAPPHGFVWMPWIGTGLRRVSGSDGCMEDRAWTRFWLLDTVPVARSRSTPDLVRSARARAVAESLWVPASLLPANGVTWESIDDDAARAVFPYAGERFALELTVAADGRPLAVAMQRWTNANPQRLFRHQPFGATVVETGTFGGNTIPTRIDASNGFGTEAYFPFFRARVTEASFR